MAKPSSTITLSVVVPCFDEEAVIETTHRRLGAALRALSLSYEIIYVNDGSRDRTIELLHRIQGEDRRVRVVNLSRNFGHQIAVSAGLDHAGGAAAVILDADLQDPPEVIGVMVEKWRAGYDVVYGRRLSRPGESAFKLATARWFYRVLNAFSDVPVPMDVGDFRLIDRRIIDILKLMPERDRFLRGMTSWIGLRQCAIAYEREPRYAGSTKYSLVSMLGLAADGIVSFSISPLRLAMWCGFCAMILAVAGIFYAIGMRLLTDIWVSGWTMMIVTILFMGGVQLIMLGVMGEYVGRIYREAKGRPIYLVGDRRGFDTADGPDTEPEAGAETMRAEQELERLPA